MIKLIVKNIDIDTYKTDIIPGTLSKIIIDDSLFTDGFFLYSFKYLPKHIHMSKIDNHNYFSIIIPNNIDEKCYLKGFINSNNIGILFQ